MRFQHTTHDGVKLLMMSSTTTCTTLPRLVELDDDVEPRQRDVSDAGITLREERRVDVSRRDVDPGHHRLPVRRRMVVLG